MTIKTIAKSILVRGPSFVRKGRVSPKLPVPSTINHPPYAKPSTILTSFAEAVPPIFAKDNILTREEIHIQKESGRIAADALVFAASLAKPGVTTDSIDKSVHEFIVSKGAYPSTLGYHGFPKSLCTSVNEIACHGIPDDRPLQYGDVLKMDVTAYKNGFHGDTCITIIVGDDGMSSVDNEHIVEARKLVSVTKQALEAAIQLCKPGAPIKLIGQTIQDFVTAHRYSSLAGLTGHGVGREFHMNPMVSHVKNDDKTIMQEGMVFTIEPIIVTVNSTYVMWPDKWTIALEKYGLAAQFEHTIAITKDGYDILTLSSEHRN